MPTLEEQEQDKKEVEAMDKCINALINAGDQQLGNWNVLARMLLAKYMRKLALASS